jgi:hypothetical protein
VARGLGDAEQYSVGRRNSKEGRNGYLTVAEAVWRRKTTQPRERPTARWDRRTQYGRYFDGPGTSNEQPIPRGRPWAATIRGRAA